MRYRARRRSLHAIAGKPVVHRVTCLGGSENGLLTREQGGDLVPSPESSGPDCTRRGSSSSKRLAKGRRNFSVRPETRLLRRVQADTNAPEVPEPSTRSRKLRRRPCQALLAGWRLTLIQRRAGQIASSFSERQSSRSCLRAINPRQPYDESGSARPHCR